MIFCTSICLKPFNDRSEFELDRAKSKNNIAENSFALGHEANNYSKQTMQSTCDNDCVIKYY